MKGISPLMLQKWSKDSTKDIALRSVWSQLSNRTDGVSAVSQAADFKVPDAVVHAVSKVHTKGDWSVTVPLLQSLVGDGVGGSKIATGTEERPVALSSKTFYNNVRKTVTMGTEGVEFQSVQYLNMAKQRFDLVKDWFAMDDDYACQKAICEGADRYLTDNQFWEDNEEITSAPMSVALHPNIVFRGMTSSTAPVRNATFATDVANLATALANMTASTVFDLATVDKIAMYAQGFISPLRWKAGTEAVNWIVLVSRIQADQLRNDSAWNAIMQNAEVRGPENRALSGILGVRHGLLLIEDAFSPIFHLSANDGVPVGFEYVTPTQASTSTAMYGLGGLNRVVKGAATVKTGTCEVARILGRGAIGMPTPMDLSFTEETRDMGFRSALCGHKMIGRVRLDFVNAAKTLTKNISSGLFFTATPSIVY